MSQTPTQVLSPAAPLHSAGSKPQSGTNPLGRVLRSCGRSSAGILELRDTAAGNQAESLAASPAQRFFDVVIACGLLLISTPLLIGIALLTRITSAGPVFYCQDRVGRGGTTFRIFKFRTMRVDAEARSGAVWATQHDPRVTPVGRFLRQYRLDEIPQLLNVLRGEMNIVGPRPERPTIFAELREHITEYPLRQRAKPGITGLAQIHHHYDRSMDDVRTKVRFDLEYIQRRGLREDLRIMFLTIPVVFLRRGGW